MSARIFSLAAGLVITAIGVGFFLARERYLEKRAVETSLLNREVSSKEELERDDNYDNESHKARALDESIPATSSVLVARDETPADKIPGDRLKEPDAPPAPIQGAIVVTSTQILSKSPPPSARLLPREIRLRSTVALVCEFEDENSRSVSTRGSGVITHSDGYVITNRHVVDQEFVTRFYGGKEGDYKLKNGGCKVYVMNFAFERTAPPDPQVQYDFYDLDGLPLKYDFFAKVLYMPSEKSDGLSEREIQSLDFALLQFSGWNEGKYDNADTPELVPAPIFYGEAPENAGLVIPGYAYQEIGDGAFYTLRMLPTTGIAVGALEGDEMFSSAILDMILEYRPDAYGGRSGSPIFWKGYMVGLLKTRWIPGVSSGKKLQAPQLAVPPIIQLLEKNGLRGTLEEVY